MAYTKQTWADLPSKTTPINATRLGHIEDGIFNAAATADNAASAAGTAVSQIGQVSSRVDTLTGRVNGLDTAVSNKVDKVAGKGLSTNDYDNTDKGKVDSLGTASAKNSTSVVTSSSDLVESGAVYDALGFGTKNLFNPTTNSISGDVTVVKNADNTYTVNGTAQTNRVCNIGTFTFKANTTYMMSGCPTGLPGEVYLRASNDAFTIQKVDYGSGVVISFDTDTTLNINIRVGVGQTLNNVVFKPMIELGDTKTSYEPYHESVEQTLRDAEVIEGKNILPFDLKQMASINTGGTWNGNTYTLNNATFTVNKDNIVVNGTPSSNVFFYIYQDLNHTKSWNGLKLTGCPSGGSSSTYALTISNVDITSQTDGGEGVVISIDTTGKVEIRIRIQSGFTVNNLVFKPMISADGGNYQPYYVPLKDALPNKCDNSVIGTVEDGTNPTKSYAVGEHMIRGGKFCTVTVAVTTSSTWTLGSNYVEGDVANSLVKSATVTATTNSVGNIVLDDTDSKYILSAYTTNSASTLVFTFRNDSNGTSYANIRNQSTLEAIASTPYTVRYFYIDK